jgi:hypothetical protein
MHGASRVFSNGPDDVPVSTSREAVEIPPPALDELTDLLSRDHRSRSKAMSHGVLLLGCVYHSHVTDAVSEVGAATGLPDRHCGDQHENDRTRQYRDQYISSRHLIFLDRTHAIRVVLQTAGSKNTLQCVVGTALNSSLYERLRYLLKSRGFLLGGR